LRRDETLRRAGRIGLKILYWLAVLAVSIVILVVLIMLIESRDQSNVDHGGPAHPPAAGPAI
jgi:hypothetical protein